MNQKTKGDIAVGQAIAYFLKEEFEVCLPIGDKRPYDLVAEKNKKFLRIQCKFSASKRGDLSLRISGYYSGTYKSVPYADDSYDFLWITTEDGNYLIPSERVKGKKSITPRSMKDCRLS